MIMKSSSNSLRLEEIKYCNTRCIYPLSKPSSKGEDEGQCSQAN